MSVNMIIVIAALLCFLVDTIMSRSIQSLGLFFLTLALLFK